MKKLLAILLIVCGCHPPVFKEQPSYDYHYGERVSGDCGDGRRSSYHNSRR